MHVSCVHYFRVIKNITLSAEEKLIASARERALQERTTLNNVFREWLAGYGSNPGSGQGYADLMKQLKKVSVGRRFTREELNER
jgi:hypothetical protein